MPKVSIEYSNNIDATALNLDAMVNDVHSALSACDTVSPTQVKVVAYPCTAYALGDCADNNAVIMMTLQMFTGRTHDQKATMSKACTTAVKAFIDNYDTDLNIGVLCYVHEVERDLTFNTEGQSLKQAVTGKFAPH